VRVSKVRFDDWMVVEILREVSSVWEDEDVDGINTYARFGFVGDRKIEVGLYGRDCAPEGSKSRAKPAARDINLSRIVP
jgi:hypothetical protein